MQHLLENIGTNDNLDYLDIYVLLKALVEAVEAIGVDKHMASLGYVHTQLAEAQWR